MTCTLLHHGVEDLYPLNFSPFGLKYQKGEKERKGIDISLMLEVLPWEVIVTIVVVGVRDHQLAGTVDRSCEMSHA